MQTPRATLAQVARKAGVSHITVSRVVRGVDVVRPETVKKVRAAITSLRYRPDPMLSALANYRTTGSAHASDSVIAFLENEQSPYSHIVQEGAQREALALGYRLESFVVSDDAEAQRRTSRMLFHRGVRGLIFGTSFTPREFTGWDWEEFAAVSLGAVTHQPSMHAVAIDYFHGASTACQILKDEGCSRIGLVVTPRYEARTDHRWLGGYLASLAGAPPLCSAVTSLRRLRAWARDNSVDGVLTIHAEVTHTLTGIKTVHLNDIHRFPQVPYYSLDPGKIGEEGVRVLHPLLMKRDYGIPTEPKMVAVRGSWRTEAA